MARKKVTLELSADEAASLYYLALDAQSGWGEPFKDVDYLVDVIGWEPKDPYKSVKTAAKKLLGELK